MVEAFPEEVESVRGALREKYNSLLQRLRQSRVLGMNNRLASDLPQSPLTYPWANYGKLRPRFWGPEPCKAFFFFFCTEQRPIFSVSVFNLHSMFILHKVRERKQTSRWGLWFWTNEDRGENIWADCGDTSHRLSCTCGWWRRARRTSAASEGQQCRGNPRLAKAPATIPLPKAASHQYAVTKGTRQTPCPRRLLLVHTAELQPGRKHIFYAWRRQTTAQRPPAARYAFQSCSPNLKNLY